MKVIVPVAGYGTRLLPHTKRRQKCLLPVAGKPVIDHILERLIEQGLEPIVLISGYHERQLKDHLEKYDAHFSFIRQAEALGLGHAVFLGLENNDEPVMIQLGDVIYHHDFVQFCDSENHRIAVDRVPDPERFGIAEVKGNRIAKVYEKPQNPPTNLALIGLYYMSSQKSLREAIKYVLDRDITTGGEVQLADAFQTMIDHGEVITFESVPRWFDCGIPETFLSTNRALLTPSGISINSCEIIEPIHVGKGCRIENSSIGPHVTIMDGCHISGSTVRDAIVLWNARLEGVTVDHVIIAEG